MPQRQVTQCPNNFQIHAAGNRNAQRTQPTHNTIPSERKCNACGERGHYTNQCPNPCARPPQTAMSTPAPTHGANSITVAAKKNNAHGRVNHVAVEEALEAPNIAIGMFFINDTSAVVLFHSGASHSFISTAYVEKHNLPLALLKCQMIDGSQGGDMPARQLCLKVNTKIRG
jgi:hypothetical protein